MESRNIKTVDEHGIDRIANVICGFSVDNSKYVLYSIGRDEESDNIFVSKLADNLDHTSNMVNIEDQMERTKINEIVKDMITYSLRDENDHSKSDIELPGGNIVKICDVLFNKEQNITVSNTYVATVKKSVSKVSEDFYKAVENSNELDKVVAAPQVKEPEPVSETNNIENELLMAMPDLNLNAPIIEEEPVEAPTEAPIQEAPVVEPLNTEPEPKVEEAVPTEELPKVEPVEIPQIEPVSAPVLEPEINIQSVEEPTINPVEPVMETVPSVEPIIEEKKVEVPEVAPVQETPVVEPLKVEPIIAPSVAQIPEPVSTPTPLSVVEPVVDTPVAITPSPVVEDTGTKLFFDGTNESNLNKALDEVSSQKVVTAPQDGVESLREFGVDAPSTEPAPAVASENVKTLTRSKGFANNKFFMAIAILFFVAACVFLGYEAFQYFQIK